MRIIIATAKSWNIENAEKLLRKWEGLHSISIITSKEELSIEHIREYNPDYIFIPHWSFIIPKSVYDSYKCVVFHMTDLPFGRGGSPLQNLIEMGIEKTKISAIKVSKEIDAGDIYLKKDLGLYGSAEEILIRASKIIFNIMIPEIVSNIIKPTPQEGDVVNFKRRTPEQSRLKEEFHLDKIYDYIRMLDGEGYPKAFLQFGRYKLLFSRASLKHGRILADVEIVEEGVIHE